MPISSRLRADLALGICAIIWGATFVVIKDALPNISTVAYIAVRFGLAAVIMACVYRRAVRELTWSAVWAGAQIGLVMFGGYMFQVGGLRQTTPSKAAFVTGMYVVFVPIFLAVFGRRRISPWIWLGVIAAVVGLYFLSVPQAGFSALNRGDPIVLGCAVMFALHLIFISRALERHSVAAVSFLQVATTAVLATVLVPLAAATGWEKPRIAWSGFLVFAILATSIGATVICFSLQTWAQKRTSTSHAALLLSLEPVFAAVTSVSLGQEHIGHRMLTGAALILAGILVAEWKASPETGPSEIPA
jgi:drug/metabolite transporter (DMT)-like permease